MQFRGQYEITSCSSELWASHLKKKFSQCFGEGQLSPSTCPPTPSWAPSPWPPAPRRPDGHAAACRGLSFSSAPGHEDGQDEHCKCQISRWHYQNQDPEVCGVQCKRIIHLIFSLLQLLLLNLDDLSLAVPEWEIWGPESRPASPLFPLEFQLLISQLLPLQFFLSKMVFWTPIKDSWIPERWIARFSKDNKTDLTFYPLGQTPCACSFYPSTKAC